MKRDMDMVRDLLLQIEGLEQPIVVDEQTGNSAEVVYHVRMLIQAGMIEGTASGLAAVHGLTWAGHDFLDSIRDDSVWAKAKEIVKESVKSAPAEFMKELCKAGAQGVGHAVAAYLASHRGA